MSLAKLFIGDAAALLGELASNSVDLVLTSPPYWSLRDYNVPGQIGLEPRPDAYIQRLISVFDQVQRVLKPTGSAYIVLGDTYCSSGKWGGPSSQTIQNGRPTAYPTGRRPHQVLKPDGGWIQRKQLMLIPSRFAVAMQERGWILRNDIIWHKTNGLPASVKDRLSNRYDHVFHFVKGPKYYYSLDAIREPYKPTSFKRFGGFLAQHFAKQDTKYSTLNLPRDSQYSQSRIVAPTWLRQFDDPPDGNRAGNSHKIQILYRMSKGRVGHGHYGGGRYVGIGTSTFGKNPGDVWTLAASSYRGAHFAVYPEKLCVRPILSSCPPHVCRRCGVPKREVVGAHNDAAFNIRVRDAQKGVLAAKWGARFKASSLEVKNYREFFYRPIQRERIIAGGCDCDAGFEPGVVLDPFAGSGTTLRVALELGRRAIGIDVNRAYVPLIRQRVLELQDEDIVFSDCRVSTPGDSLPQAI